MDRPTTDDLSRLFAELAADPQRWDVFAALAAVEAATPEQPRIGEALEPGQEAVELAHVADFSFPRTTVAGWQPDGRRPTLQTRHLGLTGPMGPLPLHLTEIAIYERARRGPKPFNQFLDLLAARPLQQFYRAWANAHPAANAARPGDDLFAAYIGAVTGVTELAFLVPETRPDMADSGHFDGWRKLPYGGHLASLRSPSAIAALLSDLLGRKVTVREAVGRWHEVPPHQRSRLGRSDTSLGQGATLGGRFWTVEYDVGFAIRARSMADLYDLLPGGRSHQLLAEAARASLPHHINWRAHVAISEHLIQPARLGGKADDGALPTRLGWTSWMAPRGRARSRHDLTIHERTHQPAHPAADDAAAIEEAA
ncbi:MAG: type VI secretion system baseplate subunit TssG [Sphingomonadales bacterium]|jgi:type VI secretion system protein ImpH